MLEELLIFTRGGLILWALSPEGFPRRRAHPLLPPRGPIRRRRRRLPGRQARAQVGLPQRALVAVYRRVLRLLYLDDLLAAVRAGLPPQAHQLRRLRHVFRQLHLEAQARADEMNNSKQAPVTSRPPSQTASHKAGPKVPGDDSGNAGGSKQAGSDGDSGKKENSGGDPKPKDGGAFDLSTLQNLRNRVIRRNNNKPNNKPDIKGRHKNPNEPSDKKLDFSDAAERGKVTDHVAIKEGQSKMDKDEQVGDGPEAKGWFSSVFQSIAVGNKVIDMSGLQRALKALKDRLMTKNLAEEIAEKLCESIAASLEGKKLGSFTSIASTVRAATEEALLRILTPSRSIDILRDVHASKERERPYVIVFVGVNGVGKSTNLQRSLTGSSSTTSV
ncbi:hypothetical protein PAHAL_3G113500 [Panicum hallii]|jgi:signal recognition particle receptor subunit alpha|uniref:Uncharacterized protein n=1 Tax=Panicum hallii TaxID=206008 RepID=A0A2T8KHW2_9POAL|nr:hypothetical protein PAHAL_3G113500 [Panicum hallii]